MKRRNLIAALVALGSLLAAFAADVDVSKIPPASDKKDVTFEKDIKPIFEKSCVKCHGAEKPKGKLRLDTLAGVLKGGEDGKVVDPGNSAKSALVHSVGHVGDEDEWMPPLKNKANIGPLTKEQV